MHHGFMQISAHGAEGGYQSQDAAEAHSFPTVVFLLLRITWI